MRPLFGAMLPLALAACAGHQIGDRLPLPADASSSIPPGRGVLAFTFGPELRLAELPVTMTLQRYDPDTGRVMDDVGAGVITAKYATQPRLGFAKRDWTYTLPSGHYAIASIETTRVYYWLNFSGAFTGRGSPEASFAGLAVALLVDGVVLGASAIVDEVKHRAVSFVDGDGRLTLDAPRFEVQAGAVTYIGGIELAVEERPYQLTLPWLGGADPADPCQVGLELFTDRRIVVEYRFVPREIEAYLIDRQLGAYPLSAEPLVAFDHRRFVLDDYAEGWTKSRSLPRAPPTVRAPGPADPALTAPRCRPSART